MWALVWLGFYLLSSAHPDLHSDLSLPPAYTGLSLCSPILHTFYLFLEHFLSVLLKNWPSMSIGVMLNREFHDSQITNCPWDSHIIAVSLREETLVGMCQA